MTRKEKIRAVEFAVYTIGNKIQVSLYEDGHKFCDFRLTMNETESMVQKLNQAKSDLMFKMCKTKPYSKRLEVVSTKHTDTGLTMKCRINTEK